jgi:hypothetical protein
MKLKFSFTVMSLALLSGCSFGEREIMVENCGEPIEISDCQWKGQLFTCMVTNRSADTFRGVPVWKYDEQGKLLDKAPYRYAAGLLPGDSSREKLPVTKYNKDQTVKIIFCRKQPAG